MKSVAWGVVWRLYLTPSSHAGVIFAAEPSTRATDCECPRFPWWNWLSRSSPQNGQDEDLKQHFVIPHPNCPTLQTPCISHHSVLDIKLPRATPDCVAVDSTIPRYTRARYSTMSYSTLNVIYHPTAKSPPPVLLGDFPEEHCTWNVRLCQGSF